jgi:phospholipase/carboxylesterase
MRQLGSIKCIEVPSHKDNAHLLILFHGYGADAYDLQTLSDVIETPWPTDWLFPQGPMEVPIGPGWTGRAWWNINMDAIQEAAARGEHRDLSEEYPEGLKKIRPRIFEMIEKTGIPWKRVILGGFSQGAMLATDIFLHAPETAKALLILSGNLLCKKDWVSLIKNHEGGRFFMSHGKNDAVLAHSGAARLETALTQNGMKGRLLSFAGGHEIPPQIILAARDFLKTLS